MGDVASDTSCKTETNRKGKSAIAPWIVHWRHIGRKILHARTCHIQGCPLTFCEETKTYLKHVCACPGCDSDCKTTKKVMDHVETCILVTCKVCSHYRVPYPDINRPDVNPIEFNDRRLRVQSLAKLYLHAEHCLMVPGACKVPRCATAKEHIEHMFKCENSRCPLEWCMTGMFVRRHVDNCTSNMCKICVPAIRQAKNQVPYNPDLTLSNIRRDCKDLIGRYLVARNIDLFDILKLGFKSKVADNMKGDVAATYMEGVLYDITPTLEWYIRSMAMMWMVNYSSYMEIEPLSDISLRNAIIVFNTLCDTLTEKEVDTYALSQMFWSVQRRSMKSPKSTGVSFLAEPHIVLWKRLGQIDLNSGSFQTYLNTRMKMDEDAAKTTSTPNTMEELP